MKHLPGSREDKIEGSNGDVRRGAISRGAMEKS